MQRIKRKMRLDSSTNPRRAYTLTQEVATIIMLLVEHIAPSPRDTNSKFIFVQLLFRSMAYTTMATMDATISTIKRRINLNFIHKYTAVRIWQQQKKRR